MKNPTSAGLSIGHLDPCYVTILIVLIYHIPEWYAEDYQSALYIHEGLPPFTYIRLIFRLTREIMIFPDLKPGDKGRICRYGTVMIRKPW